MGLRDMADVAGNEFKQLTAEMQTIGCKLYQQARGKKKSGGLRGKLGGIAKGAGAIAAGGIFGGP